MRFSATFADQGSLETFSKCVNAMLRMGRKKCALKITDYGICIICCPATGVGLKDDCEFWCGILVPFRPTFMSHSFAGLSDEQNEIMFEINMDTLFDCLSSQYANTKLKILNKNNVPHLRVEVRSMEVTHDIPIIMLNSRKWALYNQPAVDNKKVALFLPPTRSVCCALNGLKNMKCKYVALKLSNHGEFQIQSSMKNGDVTAHFSGLPNEHIESDEQSSQIEWFTSKQFVKPVREFFFSFSFGHVRVKLTLLGNATAEFSIGQDDIQVSFIIADHSD